jgi:hypothetical protein
MAGEKGEGERTRPEHFFNEFLRRDTGRRIQVEDGIGKLHETGIDTLIDCQCGMQTISVATGWKRMKREMRSKDIPSCFLRDECQK